MEIRKFFHNKLDILREKIKVFVKIRTLLENVNFGIF